MTITIPLWIVYTLGFMVGLPLVIFFGTMFFIGFSQWLNNRRLEMSAPVQITEDVNYCLKCGGENKVIPVDKRDNGTLLEAKTICETCGHENYWEYGFFKYSDRK